jgi:hypothetical protein
MILPHGLDQELGLYPGDPPPSPNPIQCYSLVLWGRSGRAAQCADADKPVGMGTGMLKVGRNVRPQELCTEEVFDI